LRTTERQRLLAGPPARSGAARAALAVFDTVGLGREVSDAERQRAAEKYPHERFDAGIGEHFSAARLLWRATRPPLTTRRWDWRSPAPPSTGVASGSASDPSLRPSCAGSSPPT